MEEARREAAELQADLEKQQRRTVDIDLGPQIKRVQKLRDLLGESKASAGSSPTQDRKVGG